MEFLKKDIKKDLWIWVSAAILICLLDVSVNWAKEILSLSQAVEVALGFVELVRIVLKDDTLNNESLPGHNVDRKNRILNLIIWKKIEIFSNYWNFFK